jgi:hypothetical protein
MSSEQPEALNLRSFDVAGENRRELLLTALGPSRHPAWLRFAPAPRRVSTSTSPRTRSSKATTCQWPRTFSLHANRDGTGGGMEGAMARLDSSLEAPGAEFLVLSHLLVQGIQAFKSYTNFANSKRPPGPSHF